MEILLTFVLLGIVAWFALHRRVARHVADWREESTLFVPEPGLWPVFGQPVPRGAFDAIAPQLRVAAGGLTLVPGVDGQHHVAHRAAVGRGARVERWLVAPIDDARLATLQRGELSLRGALDTQPLWVVDRDAAGRCLRAWEVPALQSVPPDVLPDPRDFQPPAAGAR